MPSNTWWDKLDKSNAKIRPSILTNPSPFERITLAPTPVAGPSTSMAIAGIKGGQGLREAAYKQALDKALAELDEASSQHTAASASDSYKVSSFRGAEESRCAELDLDEATSQHATASTSESHEDSSSRGAEESKWTPTRTWWCKLDNWLGLSPKSRPSILTKPSPFERVALAPTPIATPVATPSTSMTIAGITGGQGLREAAYKQALDKALAELDEASSQHTTASASESHEDSSSRRVRGRRIQVDTNKELVEQAGSSARAIRQKQTLNPD